MNITSAQWVVDPTTNRTYAVKLGVDGRTWCVPICPGNRHYDAFQEWIEEGNTPLPPDPEPEPEPLTAQQKLEAAGLTIEELKGLLGL